MGIPVLPFAVGLYLPLSLSGGLLLGSFIAKILKGERENIWYRVLGLELSRGKPKHRDLYDHPNLPLLLPLVEIF